MQGLLPGETLLVQEVCHRGKDFGVVLITNIRLLWRRTGDSLFQLNTSLLNLDGPIQMASKDRDSWVLQIPINNLAKPIYLRFQKENDAMEDSQTRAETVKRALDARPKEPEVAKNAMDVDMIVKIKEISESEQTKRLFKEMVIDTN
jgi:hypothetical protein